MKIIKERFFPALYLAADNASNDAQSSLLLYYKLSAAFLIFAVISSYEGIHGRFLPGLSALLFVASLAAFIYPKSQKFQENWYKARALSESIKTATWRLVMSAEPFNSDDEDINLQKFGNLLAELLNDNKGISKHLSGEWSSKDEITNEMLVILRMSFDDKKGIYQSERIDNQRSWYAKKSGDNRKQSAIYFWLITTTYTLAILLLLFRIAKPEFSFLPIDICAIVASGLIGWTELKKFDDLASAYGLTAHEVGIINSRYKAVKDSAHLSAFVSDAENAFSREHTQWAARRDH